MSALPKKVLLATDGSEDAAIAARVAVDAAGTPPSSYDEQRLSEEMGRWRLRRLCSGLPVGPSERSRSRRSSHQA